MFPVWLSRAVLVPLVTLAASAMTPAIGWAQGAVGGLTPIVATSPASDPAFEGLPAALADEAARLQIKRDTLDRAFAGLTRDGDVIALSKVQPEHERTVGQYVDTLVSPLRIETGRARIAAMSDVLASIESVYGVDRHVVVAVWGIESNYGTAQGERNVIRSLATLMLEDTRRPEFWKRELLAALRILQQGEIEPAGLTGSWAGAMGHTQFMPTSYQRLAVDFDGDGRRDIWRSAPDALASTAKYLKASGWIAGAAAATEVVLPANFDFASTAVGVEHPASFWRDRGVERPNAEPLPASDGKLRVLIPAGARGPAFLASANFTAILRYNSSVAYALAVAHLADRLRGGGGFNAGWPAERALSRGEREELQQLLGGRGYDVGGVDGLIGSLTRTAIRSYQVQAGLPQDGFPGLGLLEQLRVTAKLPVAPN